MELPIEIWSNIAGYIPWGDLLSLRGVNHLLFNLVQALQFRAIHVVTYNKGTKRTLKNLARRPVLKTLVRSVHIRPWLIPNTKSKSSGLICKLYGRAHTFFDPDYPRRLANTLVEKRTLKCIRLATEAMQNLEGVQEYRVSWDHWWKQRHHDELFTAFLAPLLTNSPLGNSLTKLSIEVPTDKLPCLAMVKLPRLEELDLHLHTGNLPTTCINDYLDPFVVFIHNLYSSLRSLSVSSTHSSENLDLYRFFHLLGDFPRLRSFALTIPYDGAHLLSPSTLQKFIKKHCKHLEELKLRCTRCASRANPITNAESKFWIQHTIASTGLGPFYPKLRKVELALRPLKADLNPLLQCLRGVAFQLESLTLTDRALSYEEVDLILDAFIHDRWNELELKSFAIKLQYLTPEIVDLLASRLPFLRNLELTFTEVLHYEDSSFSRTEELLLFLDEMRPRRYPEWALSRLAISEDPYGLKWTDEMEKVFVGCIPALGTFSVLPPQHL